jgi:endonuclease YncB( thermonuclease family)
MPVTRAALFLLLLGLLAIPSAFTPSTFAQAPPTETGRAPVPNVRAPPPPKVRPATAVAPAPPAPSANAASENQPQPRGAAGTGRVFNGDTIRIEGRTFRLWGIDAPELIQACQLDGRNYACGREAAAYLRTLLAPDSGSGAGAPPPQVVCEPRVADQFGRPAAVCRLGDMDLGAEMVRAGWALAFEPHGTDYAPEEAEARAALRGLWAGSFEAPWDWRARRLRE